MRYILKYHHFILENKTDEMKRLDLFLRNAKVGEKFFPESTIFLSGSRYKNFRDEPEEVERTGMINSIERVNVKYFCATTKNSEYLFYVSSFCGTLRELVERSKGVS